jgi:hypothetical protein
MSGLLGRAAGWQDSRTIADNHRLDRQFDVTAASPRAAGEERLRIPGLRLSNRFPFRSSTLKARR